MKQRGQAWTGKVVLPTCQDSPQSWGDTCSWPPSSWRWRRPACDWRSRWPLDGQSRQRRLTLTEIWRSSAPWAGFPGSPSYARWGHLGGKGERQFHSSVYVWLCSPWMNRKLINGQSGGLWRYSTEHLSKTDTLYWHKSLIESNLIIRRNLLKLYRKRFFEPLKEPPVSTIIGLSVLLNLTQWLFLLLKKKRRLPSHSFCSQINAFSSSSMWFSVKRLWKKSRALPVKQKSSPFLLASVSR